MKKGLRLYPVPGVPQHMGDAEVRIAALMKKGLRHNPVRNALEYQHAVCPNCCPDEEGIKTPKSANSALPRPFSCPNCCPDEEGIKTPLQIQVSGEHLALSELLP